MKRIAILTVLIPLLAAGSARATTVDYEPCPLPPIPGGTLGCYIPATDTIYVHPDLPRNVGLGVLAHEWGHVYDRFQLDDSQRERLSALLHWPTWEPEHFAAQYASCHLSLHERKAASPFTRVKEKRDEPLCRMLAMNGRDHITGRTSSWGDRRLGR